MSFDEQPPSPFLGLAILMLNARNAPTDLEQKYYIGKMGAVVKHHKEEGRTFDEFIEFCTHYSGGHTPDPENVLILTIKKLWGSV